MRQPLFTLFKSPNLGEWYPPGNQTNSSSLQEDFCRRERFECKTGGWVAIEPRSRQNRQKMVLGTTGGHTAILANLAGSVLFDPHRSAIFTLLTGVSLNFRLDNLGIDNP